MKIENEFLRTYFSSGYRQVEGWLQPEIFWILDKVVAFQDENGIRGGFAEIGVHHGRFLIALENATDPTERGLAVDVFDDQQLNIDGSGKGSLDLLRSNIQAHCRVGGRIDIRKLDSTSREAHRLFAGLDHPVSLLSIDGGHTKQHLINDMGLAELCLANGGAIFVDDYCNPGFPGVTEGLFTYWLQGGRLLPVCAAGGKILLTTLSYAGAMRQAFASALRAEPGFRVRATEAAGHTYLSFRRNTGV